MDWETWAIIIYGVGFVITLVFNAMAVVFVTNWLTVLRNALLWPFFLPVLIALWWAER